MSVSYVRRVTSRDLVLGAVAVLLGLALSLGTNVGGFGAPPAAAVPVPSSTLPVSTFVAVEPARLMDTRSACRSGVTQPTIDCVAAGGGAFTGARNLQVLGRGNVPTAGVSAVAVNITVISSNSGYTTAYPTGAARPNASNLNHQPAPKVSRSLIFRGGCCWHRDTAAPADPVSNMAIVKVGAGGQITIFNSSAAEVFVDVMGWYSTNGDHNGLTPARLADSRATGATVDGQGRAQGAYSGSRSVKVTGRGGVPASGVGTVVVNVTVTQPVGDGYTTVHPTGATRPNASNLNFSRNLTVAGLVVVKVGSGGNIELFNSARTHVIVDVLGWFPTASQHTALNPARLLDTRPTGSTIDGLHRASGLAAGDLHLKVAGRGGVPASGVGAVVLNVTATGSPTNSLAFLTVHARGTATPRTSTLNYWVGRTVPNLVVVPLGTDGEITLLRSWSTHLVVDVLGWVPQQKATSIDVGFGHACLTTVHGGLMCWGGDGNGQLGVGGSSGRSAPTHVVGLNHGVTSYGLGELTTCARSSAGGVRCWGSNSSNGLGTGVATYLQQSPADVVGLTSGVGQVDNGSQHRCAVTTGGGVKCWGLNNRGQLGDGTTTNRTSPVDVVGLSSGVRTVSTGTDHTCALMTNGTAKCWGDNAYGAIGNGVIGGVTPQLTPTDVQGLGTATVVVAGNKNTCAVTSGGAARCWGRNWDGELGDGTQTNRAAPTTVTGLGSGVATIDTGSQHTCAVTTGGAAKCWGANSTLAGSPGRLGNGTNVSSLVPVNVTGLSSGVRQISAGHRSTCAVTNDGRALCWGGGELTPRGVTGFG